jgi:hypothetical protein
MFRDCSGTGESASRQIRLAGRGIRFLAALLAHLAVVPVRVVDARPRQQGNGKKDRRHRQGAKVAAEMSRSTPITTPWPTADKGICVCVRPQ